MILSLDIALKTGCAYGTEIVEDFFTHDLSDMSRKDYAAIGSEFNHWLNVLMSRIEPSAVYIERPFIRHQKTTRLLMGLNWEAHRIAQTRNIPRFEVAPITLKKFITGNGRATKDEVVGAIKNRGYCVEDDNQADAIALLLYAQRGDK